MNKFWKSNPAPSVVFLVNYDDGRTAYMWVDHHAKGGDDRLVSVIARAEQEKGTLPEGTIASIRRVR